MNWLWRCLHTSPYGLRLAALGGWLTLIFVLGSAHPSGNPPRINDKLAHAIVFGVLALLTYAALRRAPERGDGPDGSESALGGARPHVALDVARVRARAARAFGFATLMGGVLEIWQSQLPHRSAEWGDLAADAAGALLVVALLVVWAQRTRRSQLSHAAR